MECSAEELQENQIIDYITCNKILILILECCIYSHIAVDDNLKWRPQGGSNPRYRRERAVS